MSLNCPAGSPHVFIQLLSFTPGYSGGSRSHPDIDSEYVKEVGVEEVRAVHTYHFIVMCQQCCEIRKVSYRDG